MESLSDNHGNVDSPPEDTRVPLVYGLPAEVLGLALEFLDPGRSPTSVLPRLSHNNKIRKPLYNLCLTSKRFRDIARPLLYRNITVVRADKHVLLFRSIISNPSLRPHIRSFSYLLQSRGFTTHAGLSCWNKNISSIVALPLTQLEKDVIRRAKLYMEPVPLSEWNHLDEFRVGDNPAPPDGIFVRLAEVILGLSELVDDVLIQIPMTRDDQNAMFGTPRNLFDFRAHESAVDPAKPVAPVKPVASARFRVPDRRIFGIAGVVPTVFRSWVDGVTTRLELCNDNGHWFDRQPMQPDPEAMQLFSYSVPTLLAPWDTARLSAITDLRLYHSGTTPTVLYRLLEYCTSLRSLHYSFTPTFEWGGDDSLGPPDVDWAPFEKTLSEAISQCSGHLIELQLDCLQLDRASRMSSSGVKTSSEGGFELIKCLTEFKRLKHLSIDARRLFGHTILDRTRNWAAELTSLLPPSLVDLELVENICTVTDCSRFSQEANAESEYGEWVGDLLLRLIRQRDAVPDLRKITVDVIQPIHESSMQYFNEQSNRMVSTLKDYEIELNWRLKKWQ